MSFFTITVVGWLCKAFPNPSLAIVFLFDRKLQVAFVSCGAFVLKQAEWVKELLLSLFFTSDSCSDYNQGLVLKFKVTSSSTISFFSIKVSCITVSHLTSSTSTFVSMHILPHDIVKWVRKPIFHLFRGSWHEVAFWILKMDLRSQLCTFYMTLYQIIP